MCFFSNKYTKSWVFFCCWSKQRTNASELLTAGAHYFVNIVAEKVWNFLFSSLAILSRTIEEIHGESFTWATDETYSFDMQKCTNWNGNVFASEFYANQNQFLGRKMDRRKITIPKTVLSFMRYLIAMIKYEKLIL